MQWIGDFPKKTQRRRKELKWINWNWNPLERRKKCIKDFSEIFFSLAPSSALFRSKHLKWCSEQFRGDKWSEQGGQGAGRIKLKAFNHSHESPFFRISFLVVFFLRHSVVHLIQGSKAKAKSSGILAAPSSRSKFELLPFSPLPLFCVISTRKIRWACLLLK